ncbi:hypothetical protein D9M70_621340 [compost metagenome]
MDESCWFSCRLKLAFLAGPRSAPVVSAGSLSALRREACVASGSSGWRRGWASARAMDVRELSTFIGTLLAYNSPNRDSWLIFR